MPELSETETEIAIQCLSNPSLKKYLHQLANVQAQGIINGSPKEGQSAEEYLRKLAAVQGRLEVLQTLLAIQSANPST